MATTKKLSANEAAFVREYLVDTTAAAAARRAGYSVKTAREQGRQLLRRPHVAAAIQAAMDARAEKTGLTAERVLIDIDRIATKAEAAKDWGAALKGRELQGKHLKLFTDKVEHSGHVTVTATPLDQAL